jgi:hypothetical protein
VSMMRRATGSTWMVSQSGSRMVMDFMFSRDRDRDRDRIVNVQRKRVRALMHHPPGGLPRNGRGQPQK